MKKLFAILLAVMMMAACVITASAEGADLAELGWETDNMDFTGWVVKDEANFSVGYFDSNNPDVRAWKNLITDLNTFTFTMTMTANAYTSPYVKIMGMELELDGNNGDGNQVYIKLNQGYNDWFACTGCETYVTVYRENGGDLNVIVGGKDNVSTVKLTAPVKEESGKVEVGLYRGDAKFEKITVVDGSIPEIEDDPLPPIVNPDPTEPEPTEPAPTEPKPTDPAPTEPKPTESKPENNQPAEPGDDATLWIILGACAAVVVVIVVVVVIKKRKAA